MQTVSAKDAKTKLGKMIADAQRGPIMIQSYNKDAAVMISAEDYARLTRLNIEEFQAFRDRVAAKAADRGLTEESLNEILNNPAP